MVLSASERRGDGSWSVGTSLLFVSSVPESGDVAIRQRIGNVFWPDPCSDFLFLHQEFPRNPVKLDQSQMKGCDMAKTHVFKETVR